MSPEALEARIGAYFAECEAREVFPDRANMIAWLGLPDDVYLRFETNEDGKYAPYAEVLKRARLRREGWLARAMFSDKNKAQSAMFQLRQPFNGGYSDKEDSGVMTIRLKIDGGSSDLLD
ncbi:hypothetical protein SAMN02745823_02535 [Sporobacter termitidis DSM 10068]|uniref:Uncharacterized protein n=2 Tax=Sporobacter TaxID=44748 RepID=A0A1M5YH67_9FIRM|nr:hypothetical protein SAMN02745823_02535 [Sporobacter termitidis DSM 10068]